MSSDHNFYFILKSLLSACLSVSNLIFYRIFDLLFPGAYSFEQMSDDEDVEPQNRQGTSVSIKYVESRRPRKIHKECL